MTDEPRTTDKKPPDAAMPPTAVSFGALDPHIDALHDRITLRLKGLRTVAFETILTWKELDEIRRKGWYARFNCDSFFAYCDRLHDLSEGYVTRYCRIGELPAERFIGCTIPVDALRRAALHFKDQALDMLAACTKRELSGAKVVSACALAADLKDDALAATRLREWLIEGKTMPKRRRTNVEVDRGDVTPRQAHAQVSAALTSLHGGTQLVVDFAGAGEFGDDRSRRTLHLKMDEAEGDIALMREVLSKAPGGETRERRGWQRGVTSQAE